jgi:hypothetical protein
MPAPQAPLFRPTAMSRATRPQPKAASAALQVAPALDGVVERLPSCASRGRGARRARRRAAAALRPQRPARMAAASAAAVWVLRAPEKCRPFSSPVLLAPVLLVPHSQEHRWSRYPRSQGPPATPRWSSLVLLDGLSAPALTICRRRGGRAQSATTNDAAEQGPGAAAWPP